MPTYLTALIERSVQASLVHTISRTTEHIAEDAAAVVAAFSRVSKGKGKRGKAAA